MRLVQEGLKIYRSRPRRQDVLSFRHGLPRISAVCRECKSELSWIPGGRKFQATLCQGCITERLEHLSADAL
jgi:hypothetical protein